MADLSMTKSLSSNFCSDSCTVKLRYSQVPCDLFENWLAQMFLKIYEFLWCQFSDPVYRLTKHTKMYMYNTQYHVLLDKLFMSNFHSAITTALIWNCFIEIIHFSLMSFSFVASPTIAIYSRWCRPIVTGLSEGFWSLLSSCVLWEYCGQWTVPTKL